MNEMIIKRLSPSKSVEDLLIKKTSDLNWKYVDVLFSFKGIYTLGIKAFYPNKVSTVPNGTEFARHGLKYDSIRTRV